MLPINFIAVFIAALSAFIIGFLFHGPLFGKLWIRLANIHPTGNEKFSDMIPQLLWNFLTNFVTALMLAVIYLFTATSPYLSGTGALRGAHVGIMLWGGFLVTSSAIEVIWMGRSPKHWLFEVASSFVVMAVMGAIIASMPA